MLVGVDHCEGYLRGRHFLASRRCFCLHLLQPKGRKLLSQRCQSNLSFWTRSCTILQAPTLQVGLRVDCLREGPYNAHLHLSLYSTCFRMLPMSRWYRTRWLVIPRPRPLPQAGKYAHYRPEDLHLLREQVCRLKNRELLNKKKWTNSTSFEWPNLPWQVIGEEGMSR